MHDTNPTRAAGQSAVLALLAFCHMIISLDYTIVFVALPQIGRDLKFSAHAVQWVVSAYVVPYGGFLLLGGRACDLMGKRRTLIAGLLLFMLSSLAGGLSASQAMLVCARAVQGLGAALLFPTTLSLIGSRFADGRQRNHALSVWAGVGGSGMALGALAGAMLTDAFGWNAVFLVNVPLALGGVAWALAVLGPDSAPDRLRRFDLPGAVTGTCGITSLIYLLVQAPVQGWTSSGMVLVESGLLLFLGAFVLVEKRSSDPLLPLDLCRNRSLAAGMTVILMFSATFGALLYFLTLYFQSVLGMSVLAAGLAYLPLYAVIFLASSFGGRLANGLGLRSTVLLGLATGAAGMTLAAMAMGRPATYADLLPGLMLYSAGMGLTFTAMFGLATGDVAPGAQGVASGLASTCQQLGNALGIALLVPVSDPARHAIPGADWRAAAASGIEAVFLCACAGVLAMIALLALSGGGASLGLRQGGNAQ